MYKIVGRIVEGRDTIGYRLIDENKQIINRKREDVIRLVKAGQVVGVRFDQRNNKLSSTDKKIDLRRLEVIRENKIIGNKPTKAEMAKRYLEEAKGKGIFEIAILGENNVVLRRVTKDTNSGRVKIPSFVTGIKEGAFRYRDFREIILDNSSDIPINDTGIFSGLESRQLRVIVTNPNMIKTAKRMFSGCKKLRHLDLSDFSLTEVDSTVSMFEGCENLEQIIFSRDKCTKIQRADLMFYGCNKLERLDLSWMDTYNMVYFDNMFDGCEQLKEIDLSNFKGNSAFSTGGMFRCCKNLKSVNLINFLSEKDYFEASYMFYGCDSLEVVLTEDTRIQAEAKKIIQKRFDNEIMMAEIKRAKIEREARDKIRAHERKLAQIDELYRIAYEINRLMYQEKYCQAKQLRERGIRLAKSYNLDFKF